MQARAEFRAQKALTRFRRGHDASQRKANARRRLHRHCAAARQCTRRINPTPGTLRSVGFGHQARQAEPCSPFRPVTPAADPPPPCASHRFQECSSPADSDAINAAAGYASVPARLPVCVVCAREWVMAHTTHTGRFARAGSSLIRSAAWQAEQAALGVLAVGWLAGQAGSQAVQGWQVRRQWRGSLAWRARLSWQRGQLAGRVRWACVRCWWALLLRLGCQAPRGLQPGVWCPWLCRWWQAGAFVAGLLGRALLAVVLAAAVVAVVSCLVVFLLT